MGNVRDCFRSLRDCLGGKQEEICGDTVRAYEYNGRLFKDKEDMKRAREADIERDRKDRLTHAFLNYYNGYPVRHIDNHTATIRYDKHRRLLHRDGKISHRKLVDFIIDYWPLLQQIHFETMRKIHEERNA